VDPIGIDVCDGMGKTSILKSVDQLPAQLLLSPRICNVAVPENDASQSAVTEVPVPESVAAALGVITHSYEVAFATGEIV